MADCKFLSIPLLCTVTHCRLLQRISQEVLVQAPDNNDIDGRVTVTAFHAVVSVQDPGYNFNGSTYNMTVLVDDNDSPGMRAVPRNVAVKEVAQS